MHNLDAEVTEGLRRAIEDNRARAGMDQAQQQRPMPAEVNAPNHLSSDLYKGYAGSMYGQSTTHSLAGQNLAGNNLNQSQPAQQTLRQRLIEQKTALTNQLKDIDNALLALDSNPEFEKTANILARVNGQYPFLRY